METQESPFSFLPLQVEREPMWDGNGKDFIISIQLPCVEREPMWDGNESSTIAGTYFLR